MTLALPVPFRAIAAGALVATLLLGALTRPASAEKSNNCLSQTASLCQTVEQCSGGFEANGTCRYILTVSRYYWKY